MRAISAFVLTVICLALFSLAKPQLDLRLKRINQAQSQFQQAILKTYQGLTTVAYEVLDETNIRQNLEWNLPHSNEGILRRYLYPGRISFLRILSHDCTLISHTERGHISDSPCLGLTKDSLSKPEITWLKHNEKPLAILTMPFEARQSKYFLLIGTYLDHAWFHHHPAMDQLRKLLGLEIQTSSEKVSGVLLQKEGFASDQDTYIANLYSQDWLLSAAPFLMRIKPGALNQVVFYLGILTLILMATVIILLRQREARLLQSLQEFQSWIKNLTPESNSDDIVKAITDPKTYVLKIRESIKQLHDFHFHRDRQLHDLLDEQKQKYAQLEQEFLDLQQKYFMAQRLETLYSQFQQTSAGFVGLQEQLYEQTENLADVLSHGMSQQANELYKISQRWESELELMSPRKFVRSLAERPSIQHPHRSELEVDVERLVELGKYLSHISLHLSIEMQKLLHQTNQSMQIAKHWGSLSRIDDRKKSHQLTSVILEAQNLIPMGADIPPHQFINLTDVKIRIDHLDLPQSIWVSLLYHLYMTLIEIARPQPQEAIRIHSRIRQRDQQIALVISMEGDDSLFYNSKNDRASHHFALVKQLIRPYKLQAIELPHLHGSVSFALTWQDAESIVIESKRHIQGASKESETQL